MSADLVIDLINNVKIYQNSNEINLINKANRFIFFSATHLYESKIGKQSNYAEKIVAKQVNLIPKILYCYFFSKKEKEYWAQRTSQKTTSQRKIHSKDKKIWRI